MKPQEKAGPSKRGLYRRSSDDDIYFYLGKFPFITAEELAHLTGRNPVSLRKRLRQLTLAKVIGRLTANEQREEFFEEIKCKKCGTINKLARDDGKIRPKPFFYFLLEKGGVKAQALMEHPVAFKSKAQSRVDHDRVITTIILSLDHAFGADLTDCRLQKDDLKETIEIDGHNLGFYPDGRAMLGENAIWIEYANSEPSSKDGVNDIVQKVANYNEIMRRHRETHDEDPGKVLFIFRERSMVENFVNRVSVEFPYLWIYATDIESIKHDPKGKIFWTPRDFDEHPHGLID